MLRSTAAITGVVFVAIIVGLLFADNIPSGLPLKDQRTLRIVSIIKQFTNIATHIHSLVTFTHPIKSQRFIRQTFIAPLLMKPPSPAITQQVLDLSGIPALSLVHADRVGDTDLPGLIYLHGGGWAYSSSAFYAPVLAEMILRLNNSIKIISVDYRLVPDFVYPVQFEDCLKAVKVILADPKRFGLNPTNIMISGDSAGGNLALAVALKLRDQGDAAAAKLKSQLLIYPATHAINFLTKSFREWDNTPILDKSQAIKFILDYMDEDYTVQTEAKVAINRHVSDDLRLTKQWKYAASFNDPLADHTVTPSKKLIARMEKKLRDPYLFPFMADSLRGLAKTFILTCEYDVLRDDGLALAKRMMDEVRSPGEAAGEASTFVVHKNVQCFHGALNFFDKTVTGNDAMNTVVDWIRSEINN